MTPFSADVKVRFGDIDHAGIVYYPRFFHYLHVAFEEFFDREFGRSYPEVLDDEHVGFPVVRTEADYRAPARYGDVLRIELTCVRIGARSVTLRYRARRSADGVDGVVCMEAKVTTACVDLRTFKSQDVPPRYRDLFARFLET